MVAVGYDIHPSRQTYWIHGSCWELFNAVCPWVIKSLLSRCIKHNLLRQCKNTRSSTSQQQTEHPDNSLRLVGRTNQSKDQKVKKKAFKIG